MSRAKTTSVSKERVLICLARKGMTQRNLCISLGYDPQALTRQKYTPQVLNRQLAAGRMSEERLDQIGRVLDAAPVFLSGLLPWEEDEDIPPYGYDEAVKVAFWRPVHDIVRSLMVNPEELPKEDVTQLALRFRSIVRDYLSINGY